MRTKDAVPGMEVVFRAPRKQFEAGTAQKAKIIKVGRYIRSYSGPCLTVEAVRDDRSIVPRDRLVIEKSQQYYDQERREYASRQVFDVVEGGAVMRADEYEIMMAGIREAQMMQRVRAEKLTKATRARDDVVTKGLQALGLTTDARVSVMTRWGGANGNRRDIPVVNMDLEGVIGLLKSKDRKALETAMAEIERVKREYPDPKC